MLYQLQYFRSIKNPRGVLKINIWYHKYILGTVGKLVSSLEVFYGRKLRRSESPHERYKVNVTRCQKLQKAGTG